MIRFNQPRYILPLIVLPFIYVFFYFYEYAAGSEALHVKAATTSINPDLPDPFLDDDNLKDKFDAFQEAHKYNRDFSAIQEIDNREIQGDEIPELPAKQRPQRSIATPKSHTYSKPRVESSRQKELSAYEEQMQLFKDQMSYLDSIFRVEEEMGKSGDEEMERVAVNKRQEVGSQEVIRQKENQLIAESSKLKADVLHKESKETKPLFVKKSNGIGSRNFNTIVSDERDLFIRAIIDEELKVSKSSRIRLRLLEEIQIEALTIPKGQYLFGIISAFKPQRIEVHISSLLVNGQILEVALDIYDLDGMKGLYVPESKFRELAKSMGEDMSSGQQLNLDQSPDNQLMYGLAKDAFNTTTQAASKAIRKNKAKLKYSTQVYLVNSNKSKNPQTL